MISTEAPSILPLHNYIPEDRSWIGIDFPILLRSSDVQERATRSNKLNFTVAESSCWQMWMGFGKKNANGLRLNGLRNRRLSTDHPKWRVHHHHLRNALKLFWYIELMITDLWIRTSITRPKCQTIKHQDVYECSPASNKSVISRVRLGTILWYIL